MRLKNNNVSKALLIIGSVVFLGACEKDFNTIGTDIVGNPNFNTGKAEFDVFAYNRQIKAIRTDNLELYRLGVYDDPFYGISKARLVSQLSLSVTNPTFGTYSQDIENGSASDDNNLTIPENETVTKVYLNLPYFGSVLGDSDGDGAPDDIDPEPGTRNIDNDADGVIEPLDNDDNNPNTDYDGDGLTDKEETDGDTSPYRADTDLDGIPDGDDDDTDTNNAPNRYELDSILGNRNAAFSLKVSEIGYYLTEVNADPDAPFAQTQQFYSNADFSPFINTILADESGLVVSDQEILIYGTDDDPDTPDEDESEVPSNRLSPRIRIELNPDFFQQKILDMEGSDELASNTNFQNYIRGILIELGLDNDSLMFLFNIGSANIEIQYVYDKVNTKGTEETTDDEIDQVESSFVLNLAGKRLNLFEDEGLPTEVTNEVNGQNASNIYLRGGQGLYTEIKLFDEDDSDVALDEARSQNWLINEANLVFYLNNEQLSSYTNIQLPERLYLYDLDNETILPDYNDLISPNRLVYGGDLEEDDKGIPVSYKFRITEHINRVLRQDSTNVRLGLVITSNLDNVLNTNAVNTADDEVKVPQGNTINPFGTILYGSNVSPDLVSKKLKLEIFYTKPNDD